MATKRQKNRQTNLERERLAAVKGLFWNAHKKAGWPSVDTADRAGLSYRGKRYVAGGKKRYRYIMQNLPEDSSAREMLMMRMASDPIGTKTAGPDYLKWIELEAANKHLHLSGVGKTRRWEQRNMARMKLKGGRKAAESRARIQWERLPEKKRKEMEEWLKKHGKKK